jgi:hypothetical protein
MKSEKCMKHVGISPNSEETDLERACGVFIIVIRSHKEGG